MFNVSSFPVIDLTRYLKRLLVLPNRSLEASVWCFLFVTLFNLQGTRRFRRNSVILTAFISLVKYFFQSFLTFAIQPLSAATFLSYHTQTRLSSGFLNFFKKLTFQTRATASSATACLDYHAARPLSTPFFIFLSHFLISGISYTYCQIFIINTISSFRFYGNRTVASSNCPAHHSAKQNWLDLLTVQRCRYRFRNFGKICYQRGRFSIRIVLPKRHKRALPEN